MSWVTKKFNSEMFKGVFLEDTWLLRIAQEKVDSDLRSGVYRSVLSSLKAKGSPRTTYPELLQNIANTQFSADVNSTSVVAVYVNPDEIPIVKKRPQERLVSLILS